MAGAARASRHPQRGDGRIGRHRPPRQDDLQHCRCGHRHDPHHAADHGAGPVQRHARHRYESRQGLGQSRREPRADLSPGLLPPEPAGRRGRLSSGVHLLRRLLRDPRTAGRTARHHARHAHRHPDPGAPEVGIRRCALADSAGGDPGPVPRLQPNHGPRPYMGRRHGAGRTAPRSLGYCACPLRYARRRCCCAGRWWTGSNGS